MTSPTLTITIDRSSMAGALEPLVFSGALDSNELGVVSYQPPALQRRVAYAPDSGDVDGSEAVSSSWQQSLLSFDWVRDAAASETQVQASYDEVAAALAQFSFTVTTKVSDAPSRVWSADSGSLVPSPRTYEDMANLNPVYAVTIPVQPIPGSV